LPTERVQETEFLLTGIDNMLNTHENNIISFVTFGRVDLMTDYLQKLMSSGDQVPRIDVEIEKSIKNIFILSLGIISRAALQAGIDYATMDELVTYFLNQIEVQNSYQKSIDLFRKMCLTFTRQVEQINEMETTSLTVQKIQKIIFAKLYKKSAQH